MNRLTKDLNTPHDDTTYADVVANCCDKENIVLTKLKHYEDIEEEIGIDLITLFKALREGIYIKLMWDNHEIIKEVNVELEYSRVNKEK